MRTNPGTTGTAKTISISAKCSDMFGAAVLDEDGNQLFEYDGYVPGFFPADHYGDYVCLDIDLETGRITNWKKPTKAQLAKLEKGED